jgi:DNA-binding response OmpR family regulator
VGRTNDDQNLRILIVEDNDFLAVDLDLTLSELGHVTWVASNVRLAAEHIADHELDVSILDVSLDDGESAFTIAEELTKGGIPFIFLTGRSRRSLPSKFSGAPLLSKPYDLKQLVAVLKSLVRRDERAGPVFPDE